MTTNEPAVSVVVPVRNEAGNVAPLVGEIARALDGQWPFEVVTSMTARPMAPRPNLRG
jgi:dolichol-phosphate mannosyltransferase